MGGGKRGLFSGTKGAGSNLPKTTSTYDLTSTHGKTLSNTKFNELKADIKANGIQETIKYVEHNGTKYVVDGHHRLMAAKQLGITDVPIEQVSLPYNSYNAISDLFWYGD